MFYFNKILHSFPLKNLVPKFATILQSRDMHLSSHDITSHRSENSRNFTKLCIIIFMKKAKFILFPLYSVFWGTNNSLPISKHSNSSMVIHRRNSYHATNHRACQVLIIRLSLRFSHFQPCMKKTHVYTPRKV